MSIDRFPLSFRTTSIMAAVLSAGACAAPAMETRIATPNPSVSVDLLFTYDACRVYRFYDAGPHYFVRCDPASRSSGDSAATLSRVPCGKGCTRDETVQTVDASPSGAPSKKETVDGQPMETSRP